MKTELHIEEDSLNTRRIEALLISKADLERLVDKLPESCELSRDEEASEGTRKSVWQLTGHGNEPLGGIQKVLRAGLSNWDGKLPVDTGYDTDADGVGYNSIYLVVEEEVNEYTAYYRTNSQYITDDGEQFYGHYALMGYSPLQVLAKMQADARDFDAGGIWKGDTLLYLIVRKCDETRNVMTDNLILGETGTIADDEVIAIRARYEELAEKRLVPQPVLHCRELFCDEQPGSSLRKGEWLFSEDPDPIDELLGETGEDYLPTPGEPMDKYSRKGGRDGE